MCACCRSGRHHPLVLTVRRQVVRSGHADPGKWFNRAALGGDDFTLLSNEHSYVLQISDADMQAMLAQGFAFQSQLVAGNTLYQQLRSAPM